ncbi:MAG: class I SAM-dependent methyltransferase [Saprospiraceae bacterium]
MKICSHLIPITILIILIGSGCKWINSNIHSDEAGKINQPDTTSNKAFESDVEVYESPDRVIWQKPDLVIEQLGQVDGKVIADLGAGTGYFSRRIAYKGATVIAIDIDPKAIQWMEEQKAKFPVEIRDRLVIRQADKNDPHLKRNEVDMVLLVNTYSYITDRVPYFTKLKEDIRKGGNVVIIDFKKIETPFGPPLEDRIDVADVEKELREAGYDILKVDEESLEYQYIIKAQRQSRVTNNK